jgi:DNA-directed RNA polymerase specialized sigma24 family protein
MANPASRALTLVAACVAGTAVSLTTASATSAEASVADETEDLLRKVAVAEALTAISAAHREVLNETILRGRTVNEAAESLGIPVGTVKSRVYYALRALRLVMAERGLCRPATVRHGWP